MPELLTANYPATVYPLPGPRQADVELMQSPVSFDFAPQLMHFKQPPFQPKYFTIFNTSSAGRLENLLIIALFVLTEPPVSGLSKLQIQTQTEKTRRSEGGKWNQRQQQQQQGEQQPQQQQQWERVSKAAGPRA